MEKELPNNILEDANIANMELLPAKSEEKYEHQYTLFDKWCRKKN